MITIACFVLHAASIMSLTKIQAVGKATRGTTVLLTAVTYGQMAVTSTIALAPLIMSLTKRHVAGKTKHGTVVTCMAPTYGQMAAVSIMTPIHIMLSIQLRVAGLTIHGTVTLILDFMYGQTIAMSTIAAVLSSSLSTEAQAAGKARRGTAVLPAAHKCGQMAAAHTMTILVAAST